MGAYDLHGVKYDSLPIQGMPLLLKVVLRGGGVSSNLNFITYRYRANMAQIW